jgi:flagellar biosynthetic protein FliR
MDELFRKLGVDINVSFYLLFYLLIWVRVLAMGSMIPFLFGKPVPKYVLMAASMAMAVFVFPLVVPRPAPPLPNDFLFVVALFVKEIFYGMSIGLMASIIFHGFSAVGQMIDNQRGVSIARALIPQLGEQVTISGIFLFQFGVVLFLCLGAHDVFLNAFFMSFRDLPVLAFPSAGPGLYSLCDLFMRVTGEVLYIALQMSMPVIIAILFADIILAIANRVAPQINVWELGFSVKGYIGVLMLFVSMTVIGDQIHYYAVQQNAWVDQTILMLQGKVPEGAPTSPEPEEGLPKPEDGAPPVKSVK